MLIFDVTMVILYFALIAAKTWMTYTQCRALMHPVWTLRTEAAAMLMSAVIMLPVYTLLKVSKDIV